MKGSLTLRLLAAAILVSATYGAMYAMKAGHSPDVVFPPWCHKDNDLKKELSINLPFQLGAWSGEKTDLDPGIFDATESKIAENRIYADDLGHTISLHIAYYDNVDAGVYHCPTNCYRCSGWQCRAEKETPLEVEGSPMVLFTRWEKEGTECLVLHWYDLGGSILYDRFGLGKARVALWGQTTWPPLVKILIQAPPGASSSEDKERALNFAKQVYLWLNEPSHKIGAPPAAVEKPVAETPVEATKSKASAKAK